MVTYVGNALYAHAKEGCYRCERGDGLIDFDVQIVGEGALALCKGCIAEAAEVAELTFNRARIRELEATIHNLESELVRSKAAEFAFNMALDAARAERLEVPAPEPEPLDARSTCAAITKAGAPCKGQPVAGTDRCMSHS